MTPDETQAIETLSALTVASLILIAVIGALFVIWRTNIRAKDDPTPKLINVIEQGQTTARELTNEFVEAGRRSNEQSKATVNVLTAHGQTLTAIADKLESGNKIQTGLLEAINATNNKVSDVRQAIDVTAATQAARAADLHTQVLSTITASQEVIIGEFKRLITEAVRDAVRDIRAAIAPLKRRPNTPHNVRKSLTDLDKKLDKIIKDINHVPTPPPPATSAPIDAPKPMYVPADLGTRRPAADAPITDSIAITSGYDWLASRNGSKPTGR